MWEPGGPPCLSRTGLDSASRDTRCLAEFQYRTGERGLANSNPTADEPLPRRLTLLGIVPMVGVFGTTQWTLFHPSLKKKKKSLVVEIAKLMIDGV